MKKRVHHISKKFIATLLFSILGSTRLVLHGIFFDLDFLQIKRLTIEGFILTFCIVFPTLLLLEWIFNLRNKEEFKIVEKKVKRLETKLKSKK